MNRLISLIKPFIKKVVLPIILVVVSGMVVSNYYMLREVKSDICGYSWRGSIKDNVRDIQSELEGLKMDIDNLEIIEPELYVLESQLDYIQSTLDLIKNQLDYLIIK